MGVCEQCHAPTTLALRKVSVPIVEESGWPQGQSGWVQKISPPLGFEPGPCQPIESLYMICAILATSGYVLGNIYQLVQ
jgi:hypothetical protein